MDRATGAKWEWEMDVKRGRWLARVTEGSTGPCRGIKGHRPYRLTSAGDTRVQLKGMGQEQKDLV